MSKKQREKVEDEVRYYQRERLTRPQGVSSLSGGITGLGLVHPPGSLSSTPIQIHASNTGGHNNNSDPSPDSSVYDTQSQQPSSSQTLGYYSATSGSNSFVSNGSSNRTGGTGSGHDASIGHPDNFDSSSYTYTPTAILAYDIRNTTDFVDSTTFEHNQPTGNHHHHHQPHSTSVLPTPQQLQQIQQNRTNGQTVHFVNAGDIIKLEPEDPQTEDDVHMMIVNMAVEAHRQTLLKTRQQILDSMTSNRHEVAAQLEFFRGLVSISNPLYQPLVLL
jgi:hypothetical protein